MEKSEDKRWDSKFAHFVAEYGVDLLAFDLAVNPSAVYQWISGNTGPNTAKAFEIQKIAKSRGITLSLDEIYQHFRDMHSA